MIIMDFSKLVKDLSNRVYLWTHTVSIWGLVLISKSVIVVFQACTGISQVVAMTLDGSRDILAPWLDCLTGWA